MKRNGQCLCGAIRVRAEIDSDNIIQDALRYNGHGMLYQLAKRHQANAPEALADYRRTGNYLNVGGAPITGVNS